MKPRIKAGNQESTDAVTKMPPPECPACTERESGRGGALCPRQKTVKQHVATIPTLRNLLEQHILPMNLCRKIPNRKNQMSNHMAVKSTTLSLAPGNHR